MKKLSMILKPILHCTIKMKKDLLSIWYVFHLIQTFTKKMKKEDIFGLWYIFLLTQTFTETHVKSITLKASAYNRLFIVSLSVGKQWRECLVFCLCGVKASCIN